MSEVLRHASLGTFGDYLGYYSLNGRMTEDEAISLAKSFLQELDDINMAHVLETWTSDDSEEGL